MVILRCCPGGVGSGWRRMKRRRRPRSKNHISLSPQEMFNRRPNDLSVQVGSLTFSESVVAIREDGRREQVTFLSSNSEMITLWYSNI